MTKDPTNRPEVEPLSDVSWARVERGLWARMDGAAPRSEPERPRRWLWTAVPLAIAAAIVIVAIARDSAPGEKVAEITGSDANEVRVVAPPNAPTTASFNDAHIELAPASAIVMRHSTTVLERGSAWFAVAPRIDRPFVVHAGDTKVRVLGTKFRVARSEEHVDVDVDHGVVEVQFRGSLVNVRARESWSSRRPEDVTPLKIASTTKVEPVEPKLEPKLELTIEPKLTPKPDVKIDKPTKPELDDERAKYDRLTALEKRDPTAAIAGYLELSQRNGRWAANALYAAGRLAADRGDPRAATLLAVYVRRFPNGANVDDARALLARFLK